MVVSLVLPSSLSSSVDATSSLQDGAPSHHHTVHLGSAAPCIHCSRNKRSPACSSGTLQGRKEPPLAWRDHRVLCGQVGTESPREREFEVGAPVIRHLTPKVGQFCSPRQ